jgi:cytochrome c551/c552
LASIASLAPAHAADPNRAPFLAEKRGCIQCHNGDPSHGAPSFPAIAARYRNHPSAETRDMLVSKVLDGSEKHWGSHFKMWPQYTVPEGEARELVDWILQQ